MIQDEGIMEDAPQSMYMFDGVDYSKEPSAADKTAFDKLIKGKSFRKCFVKYF